MHSHFRGKTYSCLDVQEIKMMLAVCGSRWKGERVPRDVKNKETSQGRLFQRVDVLRTVSYIFGHYLHELTFTENIIP